MTDQDENYASDKANLMQENETLRLQLSQLEKTNADIQHRLEQREMRVLSLSQTCERLEVKLSMSKNDDERIIRELRAQNADLTGRNAHVEADMMNQLSELARSMQNQIDEKDRQLKEASINSSKSNESLIAENQHLNKALELLKEKLSSIEKESVASLHRMRDRLLNEKATMDALHEKDQKEIIALREENNLRIVRMNKLKQNYDEEIAATAAQYASTLEKVALKLKEKEKEIIVSNEKIKSLENHLAESEQERAELSSSKTETNAHSRTNRELHMSPRARLMEPPSPVRSDYETMSVGSVPSSVMSDSVLSLPTDLWKRAGENQTKQRLGWRRTTGKKNDIELENIKSDLLIVTSVKDELQQKLFDYERQQTEVVDSLEMKIQERDTLIISLKKEISSLNDQIEEHGENSTLLEEKISSMQNKLNESESHSSERDEAINALKSLEWEYTAAREGYAETLNKLTAEISDGKSRITELEEKLLDNEITYKASLKVVEDKLAEKVAIIVQHEKSFADMSENMDTLSSSIESYKVSLDEANQKLGNQEQEIISHVDAISKLKSDQRMSSMKAQEEIDLRNTQLREQLKSYQDQVVDLESQISNLHSRLSSTTSEKGLNDNEAALRIDNARLRENLEKSLESLRMLSQGSASSTTLELEYLEKIETLENDLANAREELKVELKDKDNRIGQLRRSLSIKENKLTELLSKGNGRTSPILNFPKSGRSSPAYSELTEVDGSPNKKMIDSDQVNKLKEQVALLENKISVMRSALNQFQASMDGKAMPAWELIEKLRQESELFAGQVIEQEQELEEITEKLQTQTALNQALSQDLDKLKKELVSKKSSDIRSNDMMMMEQEEEIKQHLRDLKSERQKNLKLMEELEEIREEQSNVRPTFERRIEEYKMKNLGLEDDKNILETSNKRLQEEIMTHKEKISFLEDRLESIAAKHDEDENLPNDVNELRNQLKESEVARLEFEKNASANFERKIVLLKLDANVAMDKLRKKLKDSVAEKEKTEVALMNQVAQLEKDKNSLKKDFEGKIRTLENTIAQLELELNNQDQLVKDLRAEQKQLRLSMSGVSEARKDEVEELNQDLIMANSRLAKQDRELKTLKMSVGDIKLKHKHELKVLLDRITELEGIEAEDRADNYDEEQFSDVEDADHGDEDKDIDEDLSSQNIDSDR